MSRASVLVVGSYPPASTAAAGATLAAVRRLWAEGREPVVVSPRLSAAHRSARVDGLLAGPRLLFLGREAGAGALVLSTEPGIPVHRRSNGFGWLGSLEQLATCCGLVWSLRRFAEVTLIESGYRPGDVCGWPLVRSVATDVIEHPDTRGTAGITPTGPRGTKEWRRRELRRQARRVLGRHAPLAAAALRRAKVQGRRARRLRSRLGGLVVGGSES